MRKWLVSLLIISILTAPSFSSSATSDSDLIMIEYGWGAPDNPIQVFAGDGFTQVFAVLRVDVGDNETLKPVEAVLKLVDPFSDPSGDRCVEIIPHLQLGKEKFSDNEGFTLSFPVRVPENVKPGRYEFILEIAYQILDEEGDLKREGRVSFPLILEVQGRSRITFSLYGELEEGKTTVLLLTLRNSGKEEVEVESVEISSTQLELSITRLGGTSLPPGGSERYEITAMVPEDAEDDEALVSVAVTYSSSGLMITESKVFRLPIKTSAVKVSTAPILIVDAYPHMLEAGIPNSLVLSVRNSGDEIARDVLLELRSEDLTILGPSLMDVGDLHPGSEVEIRLEVLPSEERRTYRLSVILEYKEVEDGDEVERSEDLVVGFGRMEQAKVVISSLEASASGRRVRIRGNLANIGNRVAEHVNVTVESGPCAGRSTYIGSLEEGESTGFAISCDLSGEAGDKVRVVARYLATPDKWLESRRETTVEGLRPTSTQTEGRPVSAPSPIHSLIWALAGGIVGLIAGKLIFGRQGEEIEVP